MEFPSWVVSLDVKDYCLLIYLDEIEGGKPGCNIFQI